MTKQIDELMRLADEWADECAGCDGAHLAEQSTRRKTLRNALQAALVQGEPTEPAAYVLMSSYLIDGKAEVSLAFEKPESEGYASVIPLYTAQSTQAPPLLTDDQIMEIAQSLGWWTVDKEIAADALRLSRAIETAVRKQFGVSDD